MGLSHSFTQGQLTEPQTVYISTHSRKCNFGPTPHSACMEDVSTCLILTEKDSAAAAEVTALLDRWMGHSNPHRHSSLEGLMFGVLAAGP